jgi:hypothetical protein
VKGSDYSYVWWTSPSGDTINANAYGPYVNISVGRNSFGGYANHSQLVTIDLESGSGTILASGQAVAAPGYGGFAGDVRNANHAPVNFNAGRKVHSSFGSGTFTIPALTLVANTGTDTLSGTCGPNRALEAYAYDPTPPYRPQAYSYAHGIANGAGHYSLDMSNVDYPTFDLSSGDAVRISCKLVSGDSVQIDSKAP